MIYTSYFAKLNKLPDNLCPISISLTQPKGLNYLMRFTLFMPTWGILNEFKKTGDTEKYSREFREQILNNNSQKEVVEHLYSLSQGKDIVLLCYESPEKFCHRHLVAEWLRQGGFECKEYNEKDFYKE